MTSRNEKAAVAAAAVAATGRLGQWKGGTSCETDLDKLRKENASLKKRLAEPSKAKSKVTDGERSRLLEKILSLETTKQKQIYALEQKDKEIQALKDQLSKSKCFAEVQSLRCQLAEKNKEDEKRECLFKSLTEDTENLKNKLTVITLKCQELENHTPTFQTQNEKASTQKTTAIQDQLKDALEKNQQWLVYDQQREAYVRGLLARVFELEQQVGLARQQHREDFRSEDQLLEDKQKYEKLLLAAKKDTEAQCAIGEQLRSELSELKKQYAEKKLIIKDLNVKLKVNQEAGKWKVDEEKKRAAETVQKLKSELESLKRQYEEEKRKSSDFFHQKLYEMCLSDSALYKNGEDDGRLGLRTSSNLLDNSFLECPKCKAQYPTSQHRDLLDHIDFCTN
ncbi:centrosomal protein of 55 kDa [Callorhinchus milii]|uniref:centrosomal protein of 55 kDa n=1 Tax=Callorhinchus milii TaxID=7868 RepID=UPI001C3F8202|nr:centrosomal protein of 55 kDa [Callorhinchus milii]